MPAHETLGPSNGILKLNVIPYVTVERHGQIVWKGRSVSGKVSYRYCPFCSYASTNHRTLNNHIRMHLRLSLACGMRDCWFITHSTESMWKHAATHQLQTSEPIAVYKKK